MTTHKQHSVVFSAVQNLVQTSRVVLQICEFYRYVFGSNMRIRAPFDECSGPKLLLRSSSTTNSSGVEEPRR